MKQELDKATIALLQLYTTGRHSMAVPAGQRWVVMEEGVVPQVMTSGVRALEGSEAVTSLRGMFV